MKTISLRDLRKNVETAVDSAQHDGIVVTRRGAPVAVLLGIESKDLETVAIETSPAFWEFIEARRREPALSMKEIEDRTE